MIATNATSATRLNQNPMNPEPNGLYVVASTRLMAPTMRSNSASSAASCFRPGRGEVVVARAAVVLRRAPSRLGPAVQEQALQGGVQRALADGEHVSRRQPQVFDDPVAVLGAVRQRLQDQKLQRAGQQVGRRVGQGHRLFLSKGTQRIDS